MWGRIIRWFRDLLKKQKPAIDRGKETLADQARKAEGAIDEALPDHVRGVRMPRARYLLILLVLVISVFAYWRGWHKGLVKAPSSLKLAATEGGAPAYSAPEVPTLEKAKTRGLRVGIAVRSVATYRTEDLPEAERARIPVAPPPTAEMKAEAASDNCLRDGQLVASDECRQRHPELYRGPELAATAVVPPARGETHVRAYLMPSGAVQATLEPQKEPFLGWAWKRVEIEGRYGLAGNATAKATGRWLPLRAGNFHAGLEGSVAAERDGTIRGEGMAILRYEPFRDSYR